MTRRVANILTRKVRFYEESLSDPRLTSTSVRLLAVLTFINHNNKTSRCDPGLTSLGAGTAIRRKATVIEGLKQLEAAGYIAINRRRGRSNTHSFTLNLDRVKGTESGPF